MGTIGGIFRFLEPATITVSYEEVEGSPIEVVGHDRIDITRIYECAWDDRTTLARQLLGFSTSDSGGNEIVYRPHAYSLYSNVYCREVSIQGWGTLVDNASAAEPTNKFELARLTVKYATDDSSQDTDDPDEPSTTYITETVEPAMELLTLNNRKMFWEVSPKPIPVDDAEAPSQIVRMVDWVVTHHKVNSVPDEIFTHIGHVNSGSIRSDRLGYTFPAGTLLFGNPSLSRETTSTGTTAWTVVVRLTYNERGWNKFPRIDKLTSQDEVMWQPILNRDGDDIKFYKESNFSSFVS